MWLLNFQKIYFNLDLCWTLLDMAKISLNRAKIKSQDHNLINNNSVLCPKETPIYHWDIKTCSALNSALWTDSIQSRWSVAHIKEDLWKRSAFLISNRYFSLVCPMFRSWGRNNARSTGRDVGRIKPNRLLYMIVKPIYHWICIKTLRLLAQIFKKTYVQINVRSRSFDLWKKSLESFIIKQ